LKNTLASWFGSPDALEAITEGKLSGEVKYGKQEGEPASWSGAFQMTNATLTLPALAHSLTDCRGRFSFDNSDFALTRFSGRIRGHVVNASYRYNADIESIQNALEPTLQPGSLLARLRVTRRHIPAWLAARNLAADVAIGQLSTHGVNLGALRAHLVWQGPHVQFTSIRLNPGEGVVRGSGGVDLAADTPHYRFALTASTMPWKKGLLSAEAELATSGFGADALANVHAAGPFAAEDVALSPGDVFDDLEGAFTFSLAGGHPVLHATKIVASDGDGTWTGEGDTAQDGKLLLDLEQPGEQRHIVSTLQPEISAGTALDGGGIAAQR
jgi:hypothetical protein